MALIGYNLFALTCSSSPVSLTLRRHFSISPPWGQSCETTGKFGYIFTPSLDRSQCRLQPTKEYITSITLGSEQYVCLTRQSISAGIAIRGINHISTKHRKAILYHVCSDFVFLICRRRNPVNIWTLNREEFSCYVRFCAKPIFFSSLSCISSWKWSVIEWFVQSDSRQYFRKWT
jgi:hypothetical protein